LDSFWRGPRREGLNISFPSCFSLRSPDSILIFFRTQEVFFDHPPLLLIVFFFFFSSMKKAPPDCDPFCHLFPPILARTPPYVFLVCPPLRLFNLLFLERLPPPHQMVAHIFFFFFFFLKTPTPPPLFSFPIPHHGGKLRHDVIFCLPLLSAQPPPTFLRSLLSASPPP